MNPDPSRLSFAASAAALLGRFCLASLCLAPLYLTLPAAAQNLPASADTSGEMSFPPVETIAADQLQRGQKGYGLSVFAGHEPVRFDVEVIGLWDNGTIDVNYLLARLSGQDLERSGILQGMSGSPVYFDGKLVGAVAFSFNFGLDPIAGITPIDAMRRLSTASGGLMESFEPPPTVPADPRTDAASRSPQLTRTDILRTQTFDPVRPDWAPSLEEMARGAFDAERLEEQLGARLSLLRPASADGLGGGRPAILWSAAGFGGVAAELLRTSLGAATVPAGMTSLPGLGAGMGSGLDAAAPATRSVGGGGAGEEGDGDRGPLQSSIEPDAIRQAARDVDLQAGDAVSLVMVRGDLNLAAHGTVTDRWGDEVVAFGHPVYSLGPTRLPMGESEVVTTIPSVSTSFKLSNPGRLIGVFDQDREAGAHGVLGATPKMTPVRIRLRGLVERDFRMEIADAPLFRPTLLAISTLGTLTSGSYATGFQGFDLQATFRLAGHDDVTLRRSFDGNNAAVSSAIYLLTFGAFLEFNDLETVDVTSVDIEIVQSERPRVATLLDVHAERDVVAPGETVGLWATLKPYRGGAVRTRYEVTIPQSVAGGRYYLMIGDGASIDLVRMQVEKRELRTLEQNLAMVRSFHSNRSLHVLGLAAAPGLTVAGASMPDLPGSVRGLYAQGGIDASTPLKIVERTEFPADMPIEGVLRVDLRVEERD